MEQRTNQILFVLLRSAVCGVPLVADERLLGLQGQLPLLIKVSKQYDVAPMLAASLVENGLVSEASRGASSEIAKAVLRYEKQKRELDGVSSAFENLAIPFVPLKGAVLRKYYREPWMRTSCDIDILVHREDIERAVECLEKLGFTKKDRSAHDVSLLSESGVNVELHFDLVEEGRANNAIEILSSVWENVTLIGGSECRYEMSDAFFYFYHIAHMAKHFEEGGCGIRPFIDLWLLDNAAGADVEGRLELLERGGLLKFAKCVQALSRVWFDGEPMNDVSLKMQNFILSGGIYGSTDNRVAVKKKGGKGKVRYIFSRAFAPYERLKRYYPILEKHRYLTPIMQVRRWFMLLNPSVAKMAKSEIYANANGDKEKASDIKDLFANIGLK